MLKTLLLLCYMGTAACAQAQGLDSNHRPVDNGSRLYNGIEHDGYSYKIKGFAYFQQPAVQKGSIVYDELAFTDVPMWYDLVRDQVIIQHHNGFSRIGLVPEKVKEFTLGKHRFIRMELDSAVLPIGYYELLYDGKTSVLARYAKTINRVLKQEVEEDFREQTAYYIRVGNSWHTVKNSGGLVAAFGAQAKAVKQELRKNGIKFKNDPVAAMVRAAAFYDSLTL